MVRFLLRTGASPSRAMDGAFLGGHVALAQWIWEQHGDDELFATDPWHLSVLGEHVDMMRWVLCALGNQFRTHHLYDSILYLRSLETLDFLIHVARVPFCDVTATRCALDMERDDVVQYLQSLTRRGR